MDLTPIEQYLPQKLAWERLRSQIARLFTNRLLDESQTPALLTERCWGELLQWPSIWPEGYRDKSRGRSYIHLLGFETESELNATTISDVMVRVDHLLRHFLQAGQTANPQERRLIGMEIQRIFRLTYGLTLLRAKHEHLNMPLLTIDELFSYLRQQGQLTDYVNLWKKLLPDILDAYSSLLKTNFPELADRFVFSGYANQSLLVEIAPEKQLLGYYSDHLVITYALLPTTSLPMQQIIYANDGADLLAKLPTTNSTLMGLRRSWGGVGRFGRASISKTIDGLQIDEPEAVLYVTSFPSHQPVLDQSYQLLGVEALTVFGGNFTEWHQLDRGKLENADYNQWVITELGRRYREP